MKQIKPSLSLTLILQSVFILLKIIVNFQGDQSKNTLILPKEITSWLATQHTLKFMPSQRKKLALLKNLKILIDCMSSMGLKKKVLVNWMPGSKKKKYPKLLVHLVQRKILFSGVQKTATKKMSEFTICFLFFKM